MLNTLNVLYNDEAGFIVSAELVLVASIGVLSLIIGLSEVAHGINQELEDVGSAFGSVNQSFGTDGTQGHFGYMPGSYFDDEIDYCDDQCSIRGTSAAAEE